MYSNNDSISGVLPVNIYKLDNDNNYTNEILYERGYGLKTANKNKETLNRFLIYLLIAFILSILIMIVQSLKKKAKSYTVTK